MPDYSLQRNTATQELQSSQTRTQQFQQVHQQTTQPQSKQQPPSPISQLSAASQQSKMETENALLREALAMSARNCEGLMRRLIESQQEFQQQVRTEITIWQQNHMKMSNSMKRRLEEISLMIEQHGQTSQHQINQYNQIHQDQMQQYSQSYQGQLSNLQSMNQSFSQNLNAALAHASDEIISRITADTSVAFDKNIEIMSDIIKTMELASQAITDSTTIFSNNLKTAQSKAKANLNKHTTDYKESINRLFKLDGWRYWLFWMGVMGGILTPVVLVVGWFLR